MAATFADTEFFTTSLAITESALTTKYPHIVYVTVPYHYHNNCDVVAQNGQNFPIKRRDPPMYIR